MNNPYESLLERFGISEEEFLKWAVDECVNADYEIAKTEWIKLKQNILEPGDINKKPIVWIRDKNSNRESSASKITYFFYKKLLPYCRLDFDGNGNLEPASVIKKCTGQDKTKNHIISHVWSRTHNPFMFGAPWNFCYTPSIVDPLTEPGHKSEGKIAEAFHKSFIRATIEKYIPLILDYNYIVGNLMNSFDEAERYVLNVFSPNPKVLNDIKQELASIEIQEYLDPCSVLLNGVYENEEGVDYIVVAKHQDLVQLKKIGKSDYIEVGLDCFTLKYRIKTAYDLDKYYS